MFEDTEVVRLSVGGVSYTTTVATLRNAAEPSLFTAMFSGRHTLRPDEVCHAVLVVVKVLLSQAQMIADCTSGQAALQSSGWEALGCACTLT